MQPDQLHVQIVHKRYGEVRLTLSATQNGNFRNIMVLFEMVYQDTFSKIPFQRLKGR